MMSLQNRILQWISCNTYITERLELTDSVQSYFTHVPTGPGKILVKWIQVSSVWTHTVHNNTECIILYSIFLSVNKEFESRFQHLI